MTELFISLGILCVLVYIASLFLNKKREDKKSEKKVSKKPYKPVNYSDYGKYKTYDKYSDALDKAGESTSLTKASIERFESLIAAGVTGDEEIIAENIGSAFESQCENKNIFQLLQTFDKLKQQYSIIDFALQNGANDFFLLTTETCLNNPLPKKNIKENILRVLTSQHELLLMLKNKEPHVLVDWIDEQMINLFPEWDTDDFPDLPEEKIIPGIITALNENKTYSELISMLQNNP